MHAWKRTTRTTRCPVCDRDHYCLISKDGTAAICTKVMSEKPIGESGGWLHRLTDAPSSWPRPRRYERTVATRVRQADYRKEADRYFDAGGAMRRQLGRSLGVTVESLERLRVGWSRQHQAWTWPLCDPKTGAVVGINRRFRDNTKRVIAGHRIGLYLPVDLPTPLHRLIVVEGGSDCAALLSVGIDAVGRFSCNTGKRQIADLIRRHHVDEVVIVEDRDEAGTQGASALADHLIGLTRKVAVTAPPPPHKDTRSWINAGADHDAVGDLLDEAEPVRLRVRGCA